VHKTKLLGHLCLHKPVVRTKTYINTYNSSNSFYSHRKYLFYITVNWLLITLFKFNVNCAQKINMSHLYFAVPSYMVFFGSQDSVIRIVTRLWAGQPRNHSSISCSDKDFPLLQSIQTGSRNQPVSYAMDTGGSFPKRKAVNV